MPAPAAPCTAAGARQKRRHFGWGCDQPFEPTTKGFPSISRPRVQGCHFSAPVPQAASSWLLRPWLRLHGCVRGCTYHGSFVHGLRGFGCCCPGYDLIAPVFTAIFLAMFTAAPNAAHVVTAALFWLLCPWLQVHCSCNHGRNYVAMCMAAPNISGMFTAATSWPGSRLLTTRLLCSHLRLPVSCVYSSNLTAAVWTAALSWMSSLAVQHL
jgi:hypothetical protein